MSNASNLPPGDEPIKGEEVLPQSNSELETLENNGQDHVKESVKLLDQELSDEVLQQQTYTLGEVPQSYQVNPEETFVINSTKLDQENSLQHSLEELEGLTRHEITAVHQLQKTIDDWEATVEKNKSTIEQNKSTIRQNDLDISYDKKNRDYWWRRADTVLRDFDVAMAANHRDTWLWLIKKHGLKKVDGSVPNPKNDCAEELCNVATSNLAAKYKTAGNKYDALKKDRDQANLRLIAENSNYKKSIENLQRYIQCTYRDRVEPIQDGVLLFKELAAKLQLLSSDPNACFADLRSWAETFLSDYILENPNTPQHVITDFRRIASISLPSENR